MTITEAKDVNTVLRWAMAKAVGRKAQRPFGGGEITDAEATAAARRLTAKAEKTLSAGLRPEEVELVAVFRRPCCDHCNNGEGDPAAHDYTTDGPHDGPCEECAAEQARREHDAGTGD